MKRFAASVTLFALYLCGEVAMAGQPATNPEQAEEVSGVWEGTLITFGEEDIRRLTFQLQGDRITGRSGDASLEGTLRGNRLEFQARFSNGEIFGTFSGKIERGEMTGEAKLFRDQPATWRARRPAIRPASAPALHKFSPREFHRLFSSGIPPALRVFPGDTVQTVTVDSGGRDEKLVPRAAGGNPLTGPFYVEGALPGDTLVVRFNRVRLSRDAAESGQSIAASAVTPYYLRRVKPVDKFDSHWKLDRERGLATLANPTEPLKNFTVRLQPMLGCVGVAPEGKQSFDSGNLGAYGGNLDYNQIREGTTVYLPVFHPGALLFVGDGHAAEGDGELTGAALETSMEVEFTVDVVQDKSSNMPRAENDEFRMALGVGGSLTEALQLATSELADWLESDYKLNSAEVAVVLGTSIHYDVAELVDPQVHVVAKISKTALAQLRRVQVPERH